VNVNRTTPIGRGRSLAVAAAFLFTTAGLASDHADPIDPLNRQRQEGGITDLFVFPVGKDGKPVHVFERKAKLPLGDTLADVVRPRLSANQLKDIDALVVVLCVRRQLTDKSTLNLEPYTYRIHFDVNSTVELPTIEHAAAESNMPTIGGAGSSGYGPSAGAPKQMRPTLVESFARYGGRIVKPEEIGEDATIEIQLNDRAGIQPGYPKYTGASAADWERRRDEVKTASGVYDDPFIFPAFFGTNVVGMVLRIPRALFPTDQNSFLIWATSHQGSRQIDHVGRSLRTQNPRFDSLNTLHPRDHARALLEEHENPSLLRDIALRLNFANTFAFRAWDFVPDVMHYSLDVPVGFPNGRLLTDDVAAMLAQHGDTLLYELSYQHDNGRWPRQMRNDRDRDDDLTSGRRTGEGRFKEEFPYLLDALPDRPQPAPPTLSDRNRWKLIGIAAGLAALFVLENYVVARYYHYRKTRRRYL
jgi:hypothetical protein